MELLILTTVNTYSSLVAAELVAQTVVVMVPEVAVLVDIVL
jgi:hypothetical protein